jgi:hypothetical protein
LEGRDKIEPVGVAAVKVHADGIGTAETRRQSERLPEAAVFPGSGYEHPFSRNACGKRTGKAELLSIDGEGHAPSLPAGNLAQQGANVTCLKTTKRAELSC